MKNKFNYALLNTVHHYSDGSYYVISRHKTAKATKRAYLRVKDSLNGWCSIALRGGNGWEINEESGELECISDSRS